MSLFSFFFNILGLILLVLADIAKMVTKSEVLYARFWKRAAELGGEPLEPKKKAKVPAPRVGSPEAARRGGSSSEPAGSEGAALALACPAPISQISSRPPAQPEGPAPEPGSSQGAARPEAGGSGCSDSAVNQERRSYVVEWTLFEDESALENIETARQLFRVALLPADRARIQAMSQNQFLDSARFSAIRVSFCLVFPRTVFFFFCPPLA